MLRSVRTLAALLLAAAVGTVVAASPAVAEDETNGPGLCCVK